MRGVAERSFSLWEFLGALDDLRDLAGVGGEEFKVGEEA